MLLNLKAMKNISNTKIICNFVLSQNDVPLHVYISPNIIHTFIISNELQEKTMNLNSL